VFPFSATARDLSRLCNPSVLAVPLVNLPQPTLQETGRDALELASCVCTRAKKSVSILDHRLARVGKQNCNECVQRLVSTPRSADRKAAVMARADVESSNPLPFGWNVWQPQCSSKITPCFPVECSKLATSEDLDFETVDCRCFGICAQVERYLSLVRTLANHDQ